MKVVFDNTVTNEDGDILLSYKGECDMLGLVAEIGELMVLMTKIAKTCGEVNPPDSIVGTIIEEMLKKRANDNNINNSNGDVDLTDLGPSGAAMAFEDGEEGDEDFVPFNPIFDNEKSASTNDHE